MKNETKMNPAPARLRRLEEKSLALVVGGSEPPSAAPTDSTLGGSHTAEVQHKPVDVVFVK
jgi:hypothetical protein